MPTQGDARVDWLGACRRAAESVREAVGELHGTSERARRLGRGEGGDTTLAVDRASEDAVLSTLAGLGVALRVVSEERGEVALGGGGGPRVIVDPIDGSLNAKRGLPAYSLSIAVAPGETMRDVEFGYVTDLSCGEEWWALRGEGAWCDGVRLEPAGAPARLEILGVESAQPRLVADHAAALAGVEAHRLRMIGSVALSLCYVASERFDAMVSLRRVRSVDAAAGQLVVREAGAAVAFVDADGGGLGASLGLDLRSRVVAAADERMLKTVCAIAG